MATFQSLVTPVRQLLQDTKATPRYVDGDILIGLNNGVSAVRRLRPDLFFGSYGSLVSLYLLSDTFPLPVFYEPLVAEFAAGWVELRDDEFERESRAAYLVESLKKRALAG